MNDATVKDVLSKISPIIFSVGLIYVIAWSHTYIFLDRLGAGWYLNNINLPGMLTIARYSFMAIVVLFYLLFLNVSATLEKRTIGRIVMWVISILIIYLTAQIPFWDKRTIHDAGFRFDSSIVTFVIFSIAAIYFTELSFHNYRKGILSSALLFSAVPFMAFVVVLPGTFGGMDARRWLDKEKKGQVIILTSNEKKEYSLIYYTTGEALVLDLNTKNIRVIDSEDIKEISKGN